MKKNDRTLFKDPASVSVNKHSFIFVGDRVRRRVVVLSDNGAILNQYLGGKTGFGIQFLRERCISTQSVFVLMSVEMS